MKVISALIGQSFPYLTTLTMSENSKGNFVKFEGELEWGYVKPRFCM